MPQAMTIRLDDDIYEALRAHAYATRTSMNETVNRALKDFLAGAGRREHVDALIEDARGRYRTTLDKLASM